MARVKKEQESDEAPGAPEWMVTFSDCMTLLLTFFVLLLSFSSFDDRVFRDLRVLYATALNRITPMVRSDRDAFLHITPIRYMNTSDKGSEKPVVDNDLKRGLMEESMQIDFEGGIVFLVSSQNVFLGKGKLISQGGREMLDTLAVFLRGVQSRIVIREGGPDVENNSFLGLPRAIEVVEYLTRQNALNRKRFSISSMSTLADENSVDIKVDRQNEGGRILEIALLDRSLYN
jgi:chemotaxis protein MotB